ncbi:hypothetical protein B0T14DRAFT_565648 [Immersiella caudata]|uniref:Uncharacterized protein n=1 Tax=Immersiella caudata TaxID=314043 RepID=A0AA39WZG2_9PEZI|nr:hypothetical protein B0T14DRAFT_565648 [Immersiella caudata]
MGDLCPDDPKPDSLTPAEQLFKKLREGLISAGENPIIAGLISVTDDGVILHLESRTIQFKNAEEMWAEAGKLVRSAAVVSWILRFLSTCERLGRRELLQHVPDAKESEEKKKIRWEHGVKMLNRMVNKLGPFGPRLYDAAAAKNLLLTSYADCSKEDRNAIADEAVRLLLEW